MAALLAYRVPRSFSTGAHERDHATVVRLAHDEVPFYRERLARAGATSDVPVPLPTADLDRLYHQLFPLGSPWLGQADPPAWVPDPAELPSALRLTERHRTNATVFELRAALLGGGRGRYRVLLNRDAVIDPFAPDPREAQAVAFAATRLATLVGTPGDLAAFRSAAGPTDATILPVRQCADIVAVTGEPGLLHDPYLGHLGAWAASCGHAHLDWRRFHATAVPAGVLVTKLRQRRPTLVHVLPAGADGLTVTSCPAHRTPVLVPRS
ncbi:hypothetical protein [Actinoplanes palleronii]|uniref:ESAT-6 protein secretion system EspG family protein n=1 Tax=Actinoplanes palleronii TaxID=113570 RepID=A0ABQ4BNS4_9ACTN|nr:hypothetical protein [Actinoplanes palleronii]GIE72337.1 hypothetical protein Apa02nite_084450 [Actinoplanes palleronii]